MDNFNKQYKIEKTVAENGLNLWSLSRRLQKNADEVSSQASSEDIESNSPSEIETESATSHSSTHSNSPNSSSRRQKAKKITGVASRAISKSSKQIQLIRKGELLEIPEVEFFRKRACELVKGLKVSVSLRQSGEGLELRYRRCHNSIQAQSEPKLYEAHNRLVISELQKFNSRYKICKKENVISDSDS